MPTEVTMLLLPMCVMLAEYADAASFDQSQSGNLNVQVDLKDLHIIALMKGGKEEYVDYDYAYDYNEMTIKPQNGTTPRPLNATSLATTGLDHNVTESAMLGDSSDTTPNLLNITHADHESSTTPTFTAQTFTANISASDAANVTDSAAPTSIGSTTESVANATSNSGGCKKGFVPNQKGDCVLKLQNVGTNALLKLVKLSQKLKLRREKRTSTARNS